ncbi:MAG: hypothetical protein N2749_01065 [Clostridia bacterium]|nr:hypothetical protein [Clostridia bacterium]
MTTIKKEINNNNMLDNKKDLKSSVIFRVTKLKGFSDINNYIIKEVIKQMAEHSFEEGDYFDISINIEYKKKRKV